MMRWLRRWANKIIEREIARRVEETRRLKEQIERETGEPIRLSAQERVKSSGWRKESIGKRLRRSRRTVPVLS